VSGGARAVLFDLDETLYRERRFALSGFAALARVLEARTGVPARRIFAGLVSSTRRGRRATAFQLLCAREGWPEAWIPKFVEIVRTHTPRLRLPSDSRTVLQEMRGSWRIALVTNGLPSVQRRKVKALGLEGLVDTVVYAEEHGVGIGKPEPSAFLAAARLLDVEPRRCVFVGDDLVRDIGGAARLGMRTILVMRGDDSRRAGIDPDARIRRVVDVPRVARALAEERERAQCA
jgi:putative hydrolase of the HAD superfamily